jgi:plasmid stabilization system protein ParE
LVYTTDDLQLPPIDPTHFLRPHNRENRPQTARVEKVGLALETFISATIARLAVFPESGQQLPKRPGVWVVPLVRYPFKIFYTVRGDTIIIIHIRHAARRPWNEER